jgi:hypothetical protein
MRGNQTRLGDAIRVVRSVKSDQGLKPAQVLRDRCAYGIDCLASKLELAPRLMGGWPTINQHDCLLLREWGGSLPHRVAFGPLAFGKNSHGHVVLHHGAFLQLVSDMVCMIWAGCFKNLFKVIGGLSCLELRIMLIDGDELFIGVTSVLVANTLVTVGGNRDSLWSPLRPLLSLIAPHLAPLSVVLVGTPRPPLEAALALLYRKTTSTASSPEAYLVVMSRSSFVVFGWSRPSSCTRV